MISDADFAAAYNDHAKHFDLVDVGAALGLGKKTVKNRAGIMRRTPGAPELIQRTRRKGNPVEPVETVREFFSATMKPAVVHSAPETGARRFILTSAQDGTEIDEDFWANLQAYASYMDAEIIVAGFTYSKALHGNADRKFGRAVGSENAIGPVWHPAIRPYLTNDRIELGAGVVFCGEMNTLPTAVSPLSGFETYTQDKWGIFPHVKVQLVSVATAKNSIAKQIMTTGTVTKPNYVLKKAGIKASFHHIIGAVMVEVCSDGAFFCRHLLADDDGSFCDLDRWVMNGMVSEGNRVQALTYGDVHHEKIDPSVAMATWGYSASLHQKVDTLGQDLKARLRPHEDFFHDLSDFSPRNHHNTGDAHHLFRTHQAGTANVKTALVGCAKFLEAVNTTDCKSYVVQSNHDEAYTTWLKSKTYDYRTDPENAVFYLEFQLAYYKFLATGYGEPPIFELVLRDAANIEEVTFLDESDSHLILGKIEAALHGHLGANGARAAAGAFVRMGYRSNTAHTHSPAITDGNYVCGLSGKMDLGYNRGLSSWAQAHTLTYMNAKRTILTFMGGRFYA